MRKNHVSETEGKMLVERSLQEQIGMLLNEYSRENESHTPDFILAQFLMDCLKAYEAAVNRRAEWFEGVLPGQCDTE